MRDRRGRRKGWWSSDACGEGLGNPRMGLKAAPSSPAGTGFPPTRGALSCVTNPRSRVLSAVRGEDLKPVSVTVA